VIISTLSSNGDWWNSFRQKTEAITDTPLTEDLTEFAARAYTSLDPAEVGILATAYARSCHGAEDVYALVEKLVIESPVHSITITGLECALLLAKAYSDIGEPRKAWFMYRRGIANAEMMV
jgi:hypothetical protein